MWIRRVLITLCIVTQVQLVLGIKETEYKAVDDTNLTTLPIYEEFDQVSLLSCAHLCSSSDKNCYSYVYNSTTRHCTLGSWLVPMKSSDQKVQGKIWSSGKFCNTTRNITVLSDGSISRHDLLICTGKKELCSGIESTDPRPLVTLTSGLQVMCDTVTDGGGWTIFQRRVSGTEDFYRNWMEYRNGFGLFSKGNFYMGNENTHNMILQNKTVLRVDMVLNGQSYYAQYSSFSISNEADDYRLHVGGYTGDAGDSLANHDGMKFSAFDVDHDMNPNVSCAQIEGIIKQIHSDFKKKYCCVN
ncbi:fibrinogen-like protein A [Physella acuta]|uniref:fibrinogen-like protein A n=1 Tax=Physella acuta TaxID=109671 RepID=UPI0027DC1A19|nr:fibrinogen-like protein A [Physella acuta]